MRRAQFLDVALSLMLKHGYDRTSLNDIIAEAGSSKGAFYHYFPSKEALLEALAERTAEQAFEVLKHISSASDMDPLNRLNTFLAASRQVKLDMADEGWRVFSALFQKGNEVLFQRITSAWEAQFTPIITDLITAGVKQNAFDTDDARGVAELLQWLVSSTYPAVVAALAANTLEERRSSIEAFARRLRLHGVAIDRLLGLPDGSVHIIEPGYADAFLATLPPISSRGSRGDIRRKDRK